MQTRSFSSGVFSALDYPRKTAAPILEVSDASRPWAIGLLGSLPALLVEMKCLRYVKNSLELPRVQDASTRARAKPSARLNDGSEGISQLLSR